MKREPIEMPGERLLMSLSEMKDFRISGGA